MKTLALVTYSKLSAKEDQEILERLLKNHVVIQTYCMEDGSIFNGIQADLVIASAEDMYLLARKHTAPETRILIMEKSLSWEAVEKVKELPGCSKVLIVNVSLDMSMQCLQQLYYLGVTDLELIPYAPYIDLDCKPETAISIGERWAVPSYIRQIVELGRRKIAVGTIAALLTELELSELFQTKAVQEYCRLLAPACHARLFLPKGIAGNEFHLGETRKGLIAYNNSGKVKHYNLLARDILGRTEEQMTGSNILENFPTQAIRQALMDMKPGQKRRFMLNGRYVNIQIFPEEGATGGGANYMTLETAGVAQERHRQPVPGRGYMAKYEFSSIVSQAESMQAILALAKKNARTESSILITGESGTGKELMAQAIHNASCRQSGPFVAINCASLPESLLESELFGYEEGAFTGALRGGKKGIFEQAHGGTLFLDEIGEISIYLQPRLLRVLQEKEIMRIGGDCVREVDVRIVAASNRNLTKMIEEGTFRQDLYYRLNVIPIKLPSLRERKEDIPLLIQEFQKQLNSSYRFSGEAMAYLQRRRWPGNIRELRNCVEYFGNWEQEEIQLRDLRLLFETEPPRFDSSAGGERAGAQEELWNYLLHSKQVGALSLLVLKLIYQKKGKSAGRKSLFDLAQRQDPECTEARVRAILLELEEYGFLIRGRGRIGATLTEKGKAAAQSLAECF